jgi:dsDNA-binding SOS-regulon protein
MQIKNIERYRMSRELLGLLTFVVVCLALSPLYKQTQVYQQPRVKVIEYKNLNESINSDNPKKIVLLIERFLPTVFAGSEISAYETIKYMRKRGHEIIVFVDKFEVDEYDKFKIYKYDENDVFCKTSIENADVVFYQMGDKAIHLKLVQSRTAPTYIFIHIMEQYNWVLQAKISFPLVIVYNCHTTQDSILTLYDNMRMIPYVSTASFTHLRETTIKNNVVCLINCDANKGGNIFNDLALKMPDIKFLGVKGAYGDQIVLEHPPANLVYIDTQKDIRVVYKQIGILLMPSIKETWGRTAVEAMASGIPVIHSEATGLVECVGGAGILCMRNDRDAWEHAIRRLLNDKPYYEHIRKYGFNRVKELEIEQRRGYQELAMKIEKIDK